VVRCVFCAVIFPTSGCELAPTGLRSGQLLCGTAPLMSQNRVAVDQFVISERRQMLCSTCEC
jgi:hypothetical protein